jgi:hypothetical protein
MGVAKKQMVRWARQFVVFERKYWGLSQSDQAREYFIRNRRFSQIFADFQHDEIKFKV